jgi:hypothetical protein
MRCIKHCYEKETEMHHWSNVSIAPILLSIKSCFSLILIQSQLMFFSTIKENKIFSAYVYTRWSNIAMNFKVWALEMRTSNGRNTTGRPQVLGRSVKEFVHPISIGFTGRYHVSNHKSRSRSGWVKKSSPYLFFNRCYMYPGKKNVNSLNSRK